jgi:hypothetical protein
LAALLLKYERIYADGLQSVDVYTRQCSIGITGNSIKAQLAIAYVADKLGINLYSPRSVRSGTFHSKP